MATELHKRISMYSCILVCFSLLSSPACTSGPGTSDVDLTEYIHGLKVINTHEHQREPVEFAGHDINFYSLLKHSYLWSDLISAGASPLDAERINRGDLEELWAAYGPFLNMTRNTSYYGHFMTGFRILYGIETPCFTPDVVADLSSRITENYRDRSDWYSRAFQNSGFELMFVDQWWEPFNLDLDERYFALVGNINSLVTSPTHRKSEYRPDAPLEANVFSLAAHEGRVLNSLGGYLEYIGSLIRRYLDGGAVCLKNSLAYSRTLDYSETARERAEHLFGRIPESMTPNEKKELEDFLFHWIIKKSIEVDLPIQIHTGYLAGNGNVLENSRPTLLNNLFLRFREARFVIFHGGYPWVGEPGALAKMFPNVYLDLVWLPQISREAAVRALDEMLDTVPYNKFFWGGDCEFIEESAGSLDFGRQVVAEVLNARIARGLMTEEVARDVARKIFRENAIRFFKLNERLGREFD